MGRLFKDFADLLKSVRWFALFNVLLAALLIGVIAHELVNVLLLGHPMRVCLHIGELPTVVSICCLTEAEMAQWWISSEIIPLCVQFAIMLAWVFACRGLFIKQVDEECFEECLEEKASE